MKNLLFLFYLSTVYPQYTNLDSLYFTYDEIQDSLYTWQTEFGTTPHIFPPYQNSIVYQLDSIGVSSNDELPIYVVKLSINASEDEDEAKVLILGQCHAEEIYGVEMSMALIDWFLHPDNTDWGNNDLPLFLDNLEIWVVPTYNPEGLNVVHGYCDDGSKSKNECDNNSANWIQDVSFRKNKTDVDRDGIFDYVPFYINGVSGEDEDGVDLNRNYNLNWIHGDAWKTNHKEGCSYNPNYESNYDYYRGLHPFSEKENQAIRDFVIEKKFLLSIAYHSSRSGCISERVVFPWAWAWEDIDQDEIVDAGEAKVSPDFDIIKLLAEEVASRIDKENGGSYNPRPQKSLSGNAHDWIYSETGCIQLLIEMGTEEMQKMDQAVIDDTIERNREGLFYLFHEAAGTGLDTRHITGVVTDEVTGEILENVEVRAPEFHGNVLKPRLTDSFGRYHRLLPLGNHTLEFIAEGYQNQVINIETASVLNIELIPLQKYAVTFIIENSENNLGSVIIALTNSDGYKENFSISNEPITKTLYNQEYGLLAFGERIVPYGAFFSVDAVDTIYLSFENKPMDTENLVNVNNWISSDTWEIRENKLISQVDEFYSPDSTSSVQIENILQIDTDQVVAIEINLAYELEWDMDTAYFNIFSEDTLIQVTQWTGQNWEVHPEFYFASLEGGEAYSIEFGIISDNNLNYRGVEIHEIYIYESSVELANRKYLLPQSFFLDQNFPNPFNPRTAIKFYLPKPGKVLLGIYNLKGQLVHSIINDEFISAGSYSYILQTQHLGLGSGIYIYKLETANWQDSKKMMFIK